MILLTFVSFLTSVVSGTFGMAGGILMMGFLVWTYPVATAAILHGFVQAASNGSRAWAVRSHVLWASVTNVMIGLLLVFILFQFVQLEFEKSWVFLLLGLIPPFAYASRSIIKGNIEKPLHQIYCGILMGLFIFTAGVSGPVMDVFFAQSKLGRFEQVATKAVLSLLSHFLKVIFFWTLFSSQVAIPMEFWIWLPAIAFVSLIGSFFGKAILARIREEQFQVYTWRILFGVSVVYVGRFCVLTL